MFFRDIYHIVVLPYSITTKLASLLHGSMFLSLSLYVIIRSFSLSMLTYLSLSLSVLLRSLSLSMLTYVSLPLPLSSSARPRSPIAASAVTAVVVVVVHTDDSELLVACSRRRRTGRRRRTKTRRLRSSCRPRITRSERTRTTCSIAFACTLAAPLPALSRRTTRFDSLSSLFSTDKACMHACMHARLR